MRIADRYTLWLWRLKKTAQVLEILLVHWLLARKGHAPQASLKSFCVYLCTCGLWCPGRGALVALGYGSKAGLTTGIPFGLTTTTNFMSCVRRPLLQAALLPSPTAPSSPTVCRQAARKPVPRSAQPYVPLSF
jgi:hypothetical protein